MYLKDSEDYTHTLVKTIAKRSNTVDAALASCSLISKQSTRPNSTCNTRCVALGSPRSKTEEEKSTGWLGAKKLYEVGYTTSSTSHLEKKKIAMIVIL